MYRKLHRVMYTSCTAHHVNGDGLVRLQQDCLARNRRARLTGFMMYASGHYLEYLEGRPAMIASTLERVLLNRRYESVEVLYRGEAPTRLVRDWMLVVLNMEPRSVDHEVVDHPMVGLLDAVLRVPRVSLAVNDEFRLTVEGLRARAEAEQPHIVSKKHAA